MVLNENKGVGAKRGLYKLRGVRKSVASLLEQSLTVRGGKRFCFSEGLLESLAIPAVDLATTEEGMLGRRENTDGMVNFIGDQCWKAKKNMKDAFCVCFYFLLNLDI